MVQDSSTLSGAHGDTTGTTRAQGRAPSEPVIGSTPAAWLNEDPGDVPAAHIGRYLSSQFPGGEHWVRGPRRQHPASDSEEDTVSMIADAKARWDPEWDDEYAQLHSPVSVLRFISLVAACSWALSVLIKSVVLFQTYNRPLVLFDALGRHIWKVEIAFIANALGLVLLTVSGARVRSSLSRQRHLAMLFFGGMAFALWVWHVALRDSSVPRQVNANSEPPLVRAYVFPSVFGSVPRQVNANSEPPLPNSYSRSPHPPIASTVREIASTVREGARGAPRCRSSGEGRPHRGCGFLRAGVCAHACLRTDACMHGRGRAP